MIDIEKYKIPAIISTIVLVAIVVFIATTNWGDPMAYLIEHIEDAAFALVKIVLALIIAYYVLRVTRSKWFGLKSDGIGEFLIVAAVIIGYVLG